MKKGEIYLKVIRGCIIDIKKGALNIFKDWVAAISLISVETAMYEPNVKYGKAKVGMCKGKVIGQMYQIDKVLYNGLIKIINRYDDIWSKLNTSKMIDICKEENKKHKEEYGKYEELIEKVNVILKDDDKLVADIKNEDGAVAHLVSYLGELLEIKKDSVYRLHDLGIVIDKYNTRQADLLSLFDREMDKDYEASFKHTEDTINEFLDTDADDKFKVGPDLDFTINSGDDDNDDE